MTVPTEIGPRLPGIGQALLAFDLAPPDVTRAFSGDEVRQWRGFCHGPFLPRGLLMFGATAETYVLRVMMGNMSEVEVSGMAIPGRYFETGRSFEQIARLADAGELAGAVGAHQLITMTESYGGAQAMVETQGPFESLCLWGSVYEQGTPYLKASVERVKGADRSEDYFRGQLHEVGLAGLRPVLDVTAPDARTAAELLAAMRSMPMGRGR